MSRRAGCNDHLSKPISRQTLLTLIEEYGPRMKPAEVPATASLQPIVIETPGGLEEIVPSYLAALVPVLTDRDTVLQTPLRQSY
jgi:hypothetical protein